MKEVTPLSPPEIWPHLLVFGGVTVGQQRKTGRLTLVLLLPVNLGPILAPPAYLVLIISPPISSLPFYLPPLLIPWRLEKFRRGRIEITRTSCTFPNVIHAAACARRSPHFQSSALSSWWSLSGNCWDVYLTSHPKSNIYLLLFSKTALMKRLLNFRVLHWTCLLNCSEGGHINWQLNIIMKHKPEIISLLFPFVALLQWMYSVLGGGHKRRFISSRFTALDIPFKLPGRLRRDDQEKLLVI